MWPHQHARSGRHRARAPRDADRTGRSTNRPAVISFLGQRAGGTRDRAISTGILASTTAARRPRPAGVEHLDRAGSGLHDSSDAGAGADLRGGSLRARRALRGG